MATKALKETKSLLQYKSKKETEEEWQDFGRIDYIALLSGISALLYIPSSTLFGVTLHPLLKL